MWTKWGGSLFLLTWIMVQAVSGLRHKTACYNFPLIVDPPCAATEMLLPTMFTLGVSSDVTCHSEITGTSLRQKGVDEIRRCCQQREKDTVTDYCLPAMKNQLPDHYYLDFVNTCTAATKCQLSTPGGLVQHTAGEDYVTFTFECVHKDTVLHIQNDSTLTGQEVYLYNDQHDGEAHSNCLAYSHECNSHVIIQLAATRVVSTACSVDFTDVNVSTKVDCKNPPASRNCSSAMFESKSNYVNMSIFMTVDPGRQEKEFLWLLAKADTGKNVTVVCGANIPADVSLNCPTSTSTTTTSTTSTKTTAAATATITTQTVTSNNASSNHAQVAVPSSPGKQQAQPSMTTSARTTIYSNDSTTLSLSSVNGLSSVITPRHPDPNSPTTLPQQSGVTETTSEATSPMDKDISTSAATETLPSTPSKEALIIGCSVGGVIMIAIIVTITVCVRRKKSSEKTNPTRLLMEEHHEDGNESDGVRNSVSDGNVPNPIYEGTDDYKLGQLDRKTSGDVKDGFEPEMESPYAYGFTRSRPAHSGLSLHKNSWVTQGHLDCYNDTVVSTEASWGHSEEKSDGGVSDLYAKVNKARGTDQVTDVYTQVDKARKPARGTSGQYSDGYNPGQDEDLDAMYAKVQK